MAGCQTRGATPMNVGTVQKTTELTGLRGFLNREWAAITAPLNMMTALDGLGKMMVNPDSFQNQAQLTLSALLTAFSVANFDKDNSRRMIASVALLAGGVAGGFACMVSNIKDSPKEALERVYRLSADHKIPAGVICQRENLKGKTPITVNGTQFILNCE